MTEYTHPHQELGAEIGKEGGREGDGQRYINRCAYFSIISHDTSVPSSLEVLLGPRFPTLQED